MDLSTEIRQLRRSEWAEATRRIRSARRDLADVPGGLAALEVERAWLLLAQCRFEDAVAAADSAAITSRTHSLPSATHLEALLVRGMAELRAGSTEAAVSTLQEARSIASDGVRTPLGLVFRAHHELSRALTAYGDHSAALNALADAVRVVPAHREAPRALGVALAAEAETIAMRAGMSESAAVVLKRTVEVACLGIEPVDASVIAGFLGRLAELDQVECESTGDKTEKAGSATGDREQVADLSLVGEMESVHKLQAFEQLLEGGDATLPEHRVLDELADAFDVASQNLKDHSDLSMWARRVQALLWDRGLLDAGDWLFQQAISWTDLVYGPWSYETRCTLRWASTHMEWSGRLRAAERCARRVIEISHSKDDLAYDTYKLGRILYWLARYQEALKCFEDAAVYASESEHETYLIASTLRWQARSLARLGSHEEAKSHYRKAAGVRKERYPGDPSWWSDILLELGLLCVEIGDVSEAKAAYEETEWLHGRLAERGDPLKRKDAAEELEGLAEDLGQRARLGHALGLTTEAEDMAAEALSAMTACVEPGLRDERIAGLLEVLADIEAEKGNTTGATRSVEQALMIYRRFSRDNHPRVRRLLWKLAEMRSGCPFPNSVGSFDTLGQ